VRDEALRVIGFPDDESEVVNVDHAARATIAKYFRGEVERIMANSEAGRAPETVVANTAPPPRRRRRISNISQTSSRRLGGRLRTSQGRADDLSAGAASVHAPLAS
jgi:hypothetical protein